MYEYSVNESHKPLYNPHLYTVILGQDRIHQSRITVDYSTSSHIERALAGGIFRTATGAVVASVSIYFAEPRQAQSNDYIVGV
jgi:hypothetical protein